MPKTCCCVPQCSNRGGHEFPADKNARKLWVTAIRRISDSTGKLWYPTEGSVVCHLHFTEEDYKANNAQGFPTKRKLLKETAIPTVFTWSKKRSQSAERRDQRAASREDVKQQQLKKRKIEETVNFAPSCFVSSDVPDAVVEEEVETPPDTTQCTATQTTNPVPVDAMTQMDNTPITVQRTSVDDMQNDPAAIQFYTGFDNYDIFCHVFSSLGPAVGHLNYLYGVPNLSPKDMFFLTSVKLRTNKVNFELSRMFRISEVEVYNIFMTWVRFMSLQWREIDIWSDRDTVRFFAPTDFKRKYPSMRAIFDGTECPIKKPSAPAAQQTTFSSYKNRNTAKVLIGVTPGGQVSYVSPAYGGSTSDRQIVERSNLVQKFVSKDSIMADKGFDVQDLFAPVDVTVNIPTFFKKRNRMTGDTVIKDRAIASKRVHVERIIGLGKTYKILVAPMNQSETALASDITFVCYMLVNFRKCIVSKYA